jgi:hypothetical protein
MPSKLAVAQALLQATQALLRRYKDAASFGKCCSISTWTVPRHSSLDVVGLTRAGIWAEAPASERTHNTSTTKETSSYLT